MKFFLESGQASRYNFRGEDRLPAELSSLTPDTTTIRASIPFSIHFHAAQRRLAGSKAAWQILTPRDTITLVRDQMILPPVRFRGLTQLT